SLYICLFFFFFSSRRRHTRLQGDWSSDVCSSDLSTGTPANCLREARAGRKGLISSPELPHAFIDSTGLADGRRWWLVGSATAYASKPRVGGCADALKTVDVTDLGGLRLPGSTIGGETP